MTDFDGNRRRILSLYINPLEPSFTPKKDERGPVKFTVRDAFLKDRYDDMVNQPPRQPSSHNVTTLSGLPKLGNAANEEAKEVHPPDLTFAAVVEKDGQFSPFDERHARVAARLTKIFLDADFDSLFEIGGYAKDEVNLVLFLYSFTVALHHRPDTKNEHLPNIVTTLPHLFFPTNVFSKARQYVALTKKEKRKPIPIDPIPVNFTASNKEIEQRVAYFREDIAVNSHHWHWHTVFPTDDDTDTGELVNKDRRGELFYYMHNQMVHRYNAARIDNDMPLAKPFNNFREVIPEAYFPKIMSSSEKTVFPSRHAHASLGDVHRPNDGVFFDVSNLERWNDRIYEAIDQGFVVLPDKDKTTVSLRDDKGIDHLGNIVEASALSLNKKLYGNLHNKGHIMLSYAHDPEGKYLTFAGVMSEVQTAIRDPIFFRWHTYINDIFCELKNHLPQYDPKKELSYDGIKVDKVEVHMDAEPANINILKTYWQRSRVDIANGIDFLGRVGEDEIIAEYTHLDRYPFTYTIVATNSSKAKQVGTCRIFICPLTDNRDNATYDFRRTMMIEMDRWKVELEPGANTITRSSEDSSVTTSYNEAFINHTGKDVNNYCGCGWPSHMLLPKGTERGSTYYVFVMISNDVPVAVPSGKCDQGSSFCGLKGRKYPDPRPMGFPFDRPFLPNPNFGLKDFVKLGENMHLHKCTIKFCDEVKPVKPVEPVKPSPPK